MLRKFAGKFNGGGYFGEVQGKGLGRGPGFHARAVRADPVRCIHVHCANSSSEMTGKGTENQPADNQVKKNKIFYEGVIIWEKE